MANENLNKGGGYDNKNRPFTRDFSRQATPFDFTGYKISDWIQNEIDINTVHFADKFGKHIKDGGLTTSQIRNVFGEMRRIQMNGYISQKTSFLLLKPKLAYAVKRNENAGLKDFYNFFEIAYNSVDTKNDTNGPKHYKNMIELTEAVLAYHKYYGGKE